MAYPILDKDGNQIGEYTREEMIALTMKDVTAKRQTADVAIAKKARGEVEATARADLDRINKATEKRQKVEDNSKNTIIKAIMDALANYPQALSKTELFVRVGASDYSIKVTKKKERVPLFDGEE